MEKNKGKIIIQEEAKEYFRILLVLWQGYEVGNEIN